MVVVEVSGTRLALEDVEAVARDGARVSLPPAAISRIRRARRAVETRLASGETIYGLNTGFGDLKNVRIPRARLRALQVNLVRSHAAGVGEPFPPDVVRAILLLRANSFAKGNSGVTLGLVRQILRVANAGITPVVPSQGSVGSSGDLAPLAHVALALIGEGDVLFRGRVTSARRALRAAGIAPYALREKEGISLVNGTQAMTADGVLALLDAERVLRAAAVAGAMALECTDSSLAPFDARIHASRPHAGASAVAAGVARMTRGSEQVRGHEACDKVQDPYSTRAMPQVLGASLDAMRYVRRVLEVEVNSATDNPLVFPADGAVLSGGNFHGQPVALAMDFLAIATAEVASLLERTVARLVSGDEGGLPRFLAREPGLHSGWMIAQYTAAALVSENKSLAHPASVDSIPTSAGQEDHNSMGTIAARKARAVVDNATQVAGIALLLAAEGLELHGGRPGDGSAGALAAVRARVRPLKRDRPLAPDLEAGAALVRSGAAVAAAEAAGRRLGF
ncbi:MAG TPA: histidine ammonia-lyase [Candidatus Thermoplasmatota archaeon]